MVTAPGGHVKANRGRRQTPPCWVAHAHLGGSDDGGAGWVTWYAEVANLETTLAAVERRGGRAVVPPVDAPGGPRRAQVADPKGHRIGIIPAGSLPRG